MNTVYVVLWGNGNTDVFADASDAAECYAVGNSHDDGTEAEMLEHATTGGRTMDVEAALEEFPASSSTVWSDGAKALTLVAAR